MSIPTILSLKEMRQLSWRWKSEKLRVGFVPTMGALHEGHLQLVKEAAVHCDRVVVSIFVNPMQFGPNEDFARYPRSLATDIEKLAPCDVHAVFAPMTSEMYPLGFQTAVINKEMSGRLCGAYRPGHFEGVLTVVAKLFHVVNPDVAVFGKKDYQQFRLISKMVRDLGMPLEVLGSETLREHDGLAMSSRNRYLSEEQRTKASLIYKGMSEAKKAWEAGERGKSELLLKFSEVIKSCPEMLIQYSEIVNGTDLAELTPVIAVQNPVLIVAIIYNDVRLIDNMEFGEEIHG